MVSLIAISFSSCKTKKKPRASVAANGGAPAAPRGGAPGGEESPRVATSTCNTLETGSYIQGESIDTIYHYTMLDERISIKAFPNWYSFHVQKDNSLNFAIVPDSCINELEDMAGGSELDKLPPYPNKAKIVVNFVADDSGSAFVNGAQISSANKKPLKTGLYVSPYTVGKNVVALKSNNSNGFGGAIARIKVNDCGGILGDGTCDGSGYAFYTERPLQINYSIPSSVNGCFPLYIVEFSAESTWGLSKNPSPAWTTEASMQSFSYVPEGFSQGFMGAGTLSGYPEASWLAAGINHPYCGPEGEDYGSYDGEDGSLYFKTIITCNYYYCWQDAEDTVKSHLFIP
jgi:hypothetical protein